ncbi:MAG: hypothetical protein AAGJ52_11775 [Pseudomonadota bacterium]
MLPVVKRKTLEVPHGLAAIAAAICLVLAFATDFSDRDAQQLVEMEKVQAAEFAITQAPTATDDTASASDGALQIGDTSTGASNNSALITWFGLLR